MKPSVRLTLRIIIYGGLAAIAVMVYSARNMMMGLQTPPINMWAQHYGLQDGSLTGHYLAGRHAAINREFDTAKDQLHEALENDPNDANLLAQLVQLELMNGNISEAVPLALRLEALGQTDALGLLARAIHHSKHGTYTAAMQILEKDVKGTLYSVVRPLLRQWAAIATNPPTVAVSLRAEAEKSRPIAPFIYYQEALMNDVLGFDDAVRKGFGRVAKEPAQLPFRLLESLVNHTIRTGDVEEATRLVETYREVNPESSLADIEELVQTEQTALVGSVRQGMAELLFTAASMLMGQEAYSEAAAYLQLALALDENHAPSLFMLASVYEAYEDYPRAIATYQKIPEATPYARRGAVRVGLNQRAMGNMEDAIATLKMLAEQSPKQPDPLVSLADLYRIDKQYEKAYETYSEAITLSAQPSWALYYARGIAYERAKEWDKAEADFVSALSLKPDQPDVLNYLGYSLLEIGERVDEAKEMLLKAVEQRPYSAHIIDSMGWAHFKLGEYEEALEFLERATELTPHDPTINDHLGDVYWRLGRTIEARFQWERALTFEPEEELEAKIKEKLESGLADLPKGEEQAQNGVAQEQGVAVQ